MAIAPVDQSFAFLSCDLMENKPVRSGEIIQLDLTGGIQYTFELCEQAPEGIFPHFQLLDAAAVFIDEANSSTSACAKMVYDPCADGSVFLQIFSHSCIKDWNEWDLKVASDCCQITCPNDFYVSASNPSCTAPAFNIPAPTFTGGCDASTLSFSSSPALTLGALTSAGQEVLAGTAQGQYVITWQVEDCAGVMFTCDHLLSVDPIVACNDQVNINLSGGCVALEPDMVLEGVADACLADYEVSILIAGQNIGNEICCEHLSQNVSYEVEHLPTGLTCGGQINLEDKTAPIVDCPNLEFKCGSDLDPSVISYPDFLENCSIVDTTYIDAFINFNCADAIHVGKVVRTWTITDNSGNVATCDQDIFLLRPDIDLVVFPTNVKLECGDGPFGFEETGEPTFMDMGLDHMCTLVSYYEDDTTHICTNAFKIIRTWNVLDWCSNETQESIQVIEVLDTEGPFVNCPAELIFGSDPTGNCTGTVFIEQPEARDVCSAALEFGVQWEFGNSFGSVSGVPVGSHSITYLVTDACGNSSTCVGIIIVEDDDEPTAICDQFTQLSIPADGQGMICASDLDSGSSDNCSSISLSIAMMSSQDFAECISYDCLDAGRVDTLILQVTDDEGLSNFCMVQVEIVDKTPPSINCPSDITIACTDDINDLAITGAATAFDACLDTLFFTDEGSLNECSTGMFTRTWQASDGFGNSSTCEQIIVIEDNTPPVISFANDTTLICEGLGDEFGRPQIEDDCSLYLSGFSDDVLINDPCAQKILRTWTVTNECNEEEFSKTILIVLENDENPPVFSGAPAEITVSCEDPIPDFIPPVITDECDDVLAIEVMDVDAPNTGCAVNMNFARRWLATDDCGNVGEFVQVISVIDATAPAIMGVPNDLDLSCNDPIPTAAPTVSDNCDPNVTLVFSEDIEQGDCALQSTITRRWTATDNCGNSSEAIQVITIDDNEDPAFTSFPVNLVLSCTDPIPNVDPSATDNCDNDLELTFVENIIEGDCADERTINRTWTFTDDCGNQVSGTQIISIVDDEGPVLDPDSFSPQVQINCGDPLPLNSIFFEDECDGEFTISEQVDSVGMLCEYTITRTFTATDRCGNSTVATQVVISRDTTPPVVIRRPPFLIEAESFFCDQQINMNDIEFTDVCTDDINVSFEIDYYIDGVIFDSPSPNAPDPVIFNDTSIVGTNASGVYPLGMHKVTYTAVDDCGNVSEEILDIEVVEVISPLIGCVPTIFDLNMDGFVFINPNDVVNLEVTFDFCTDIDLQFANQVTFDSIELQGDELLFECEDIGPNFQEIAAIDEFGNISACRNQIIITDSSGNCDGPGGGGGDPDTMIIMSGRIHTEESVGMNGVQVDLAMDAEGSMDTEYDGFYHFMTVGKGSDCSITPLYDENYLEGITTYDMVLISQHILGVISLDSPYKMIAADVNNSGNISTIDLVILRQLILYQISDLPNNTSWRFVEAGFEFTDVRNPFLDDFNEEHYCYNVQEHQPIINFIAIKVGDVNNSALPKPSNGPLYAKRLESPVTLEFGDFRLKKNKVYEVPFKIHSEQELSAIQFSLKISDALTIEKIKNTKLGDCLHFDADKNLIHFAWTEFDESIEEALTLNVKTDKKVKFIDEISFDANHLQATAFAKNGKPISIQLLSSKATQLEPAMIDAPLATQLTVYQNVPNPFRYETAVTFDLKNKAEIRYELYNSQGLVVDQWQEIYPAGRHEIEIQQQQLPAGIYYYKLMTGEEEYMYKMIMLKN